MINASNDRDHQENRQSWLITWLHLKCFYINPIEATNQLVCIVEVERIFFLFVICLYKIRPGSNSSSNEVYSSFQFPIQLLMNQSNFISSLSYCYSLLATISTVLDSCTCSAVLSSSPVLLPSSAWTFSLSQCVIKFAKKVVVVVLLSLWLWHIPCSWRLFMFDSFAFLP